MSRTALVAIYVPDELQCAPFNTSMQEMVAIRSTCLYTTSAR